MFSILYILFSSSIEKFPALKLLILSYGRFTRFLLNLSSGLYISIDQCMVMRMSGG